MPDTIIIKVQEASEPGEYDYSLYLNEDAYMECNAADGGVIEAPSLYKATQEAAKLATHYLTLHEQS